MDPAEVRRRNFIPSDAFPYTTRLGVTYDVGEFERAFDRCLEAADYGELRAEQAGTATSRGDRLQLGIGLSCYVEITNMNPGGEFGAVSVSSDGSVLVRTGSSAHGQGHQTAFAIIVAGSTRTGLPDRRAQTGLTVDPTGVSTVFLPSASFERREKILPGAREIK